MKLKQTDASLRDIWDIHDFARRDLIDRKQQSRLRMLMGPIEERQDAALDQTGRWW